MRWVSFTVGAVLVAASLLSFPAPPSALGMGVIALGLMLLLDWSMQSCIVFVSLGGLELRSEEIETDFYLPERAKWRYLLALVLAVTLAAIIGFSASEIVHLTALVGGFVIFGLFGFAGILKSRQRVSRARQ